MFQNSVDIQRLLMTRHRWTKAQYALKKANNERVLSDWEKTSTGGRVPDKVDRGIEEVYYMSAKMDQIPLPHITNPFFSRRSCKPSVCLASKVPKGLWKRCNVRRNPFLLSSSLQTWLAINGCIWQWWYWSCNLKLHGRGIGRVTDMRCNTLSAILGSLWKVSPSSYCWEKIPIA